MSPVSIAGDALPSGYPSPHSLRSRLYRLVWRVVASSLFRFSPSFMHGWRRILLRCFGADIGDGSVVYPTTKIWAPHLLKMGRLSCLGPNVDCCNVGGVIIGDRVTVSQYSYLCGASHDCSALTMPLTPGKIVIESYAWIAADVFIGPSVVIGEGAVVGARSSVFKSVPAWVVIVGSPARVLRNRDLRGSHAM